jgi:hypothetical protein
MLKNVLTTTLAVLWVLRKFFLASLLMYAGILWWYSRV